MERTARFVTMADRRPKNAGPGAWMSGAPAPIDEAVAEAARLLGASRQPLLAGLATDIAGARAAILLAERVGGVIDHLHSAATLRDLDAMRETGVMQVAP